MSPDSKLGVLMRTLPARSHRERPAEVGNDLSLVLWTGTALAFGLIVVPVIAAATT